MDQKSPEAFRTISEVAEWLGVPTHVLRFWESRFSQVKPVKRAGGRRYYRPADMELLGGIRKLLHEDGMTIRGVQKLLREKGVRHVADMSPPLELSAETKDITSGNVVELSDRRESGAETQAEPAQPREASEAEEDAPWYDSGIFAQAPEGQPGPEDAPDTSEAEPAQEPAPDTAPEPTSAESETPRPDARGDDTSPVDPGDPLPDPVTMDFLAHDATPDVFEPEGADTDKPAPAAPSQTDPTDPMSSPEALDFSAHDAQPETHDTDPVQQSAREDDASPGEGEPEESLAEPETVEPDTESPAQPAAPPEPEPMPRPALVMPEIAPDPADDGPASDGPRMAARIRELRATRSVVPAASLRALADRLDEIARRMNENGSPPNGF